MKAGWGIVTIGELTELVTKGTTPTSVGFQFVEKGINFVKVESLAKSGDFLLSKFDYIDEDCHQSLKRSQLKEGDILFSIAGALGRAAVVTGDILPANTNQALAIIRLKARPDTCREFVFHALSSGMLIEQIEKQRGGVAQQNLSLAQVRAFQIPLPPLEEQKRIVAVLDEAFEGLARARENAEANLNDARELFESTLEEALRPSPEWLEGTIADFASTQTGSTPKTANARNFGDHIPFIKPGDFRPDGRLDYDNEALSKEGLEGARLIKSGSALMVCIGATIGKAGYSENDICTNQQINSATPKDGISGRFLYYQMRTRKFKQSVLSQSGQATLPIINKSKWSGLQVALPRNIAAQEEIAARLEDAAAESEQLKQAYRMKAAALESLRQSLLQKAFSGELT